MRKKPRKAEQGSPEGKGEAAAQEAPGAGAGGLDLLGEGEAWAGTERLHIAEGFARKYNERKDKEDLARAQRILVDEDESSSDTEPEDENAALLTQEVERKFYDTLQKIRAKDPAIYDKEAVFFSDKDFAGSEAADGEGGTKKGVRYKDFIRETLTREGADALAKEEEAVEALGRGKRRGKSKVQEQSDIRAELVSAAHGTAGGDEDDLFTLKEKSKEELAQENEVFAAFKASKDAEAGDGDEVMARYWKADEDLGEEERFLRDYLLNRAWLETASLQPGQGPEEGEDSDDEEQLEKADEFEKDYNFRFEVEEGQQIQGHARFQASSVRERGDKRKRQRKAKEERKEAETVRRTEELKRLKNLKKQEIMRRLKQLQEITGNEDTALGSISLDGDFDPEAHDQEMAGLLGDGYEEREEDLGPEELARLPQGCEDLDVSRAAEEVLRRRGRSKAKAKAAEADAGEDEPEEEQDPEVWWLCDGCHKGIPAGKRRFDCSVCENFTLCVKCFRIRKHPHAFVRRRVPERNMPPEDLKDLAPSQDYAQEVLDEYFQLDYEDIIGGDLPTRFKYRKVEANNYGLSASEVLSKTDKELNKVVSLKKLRPYLGEAETAGEAPRTAAKQQWHRQAPGKARGRGRPAAGGQQGLSAERLRAYNLQRDRRKAK